jgi:hypothetical protein
MADEADDDDRPGKPTWREVKDGRAEERQRRELERRALAVLAGRGPLTLATALVLLESQGLSRPEADGVLGGLLERGRIGISGSHYVGLVVRVHGDAGD